MNVGIIGCGHIASKLANTLKETKTIKVIAAGSRSKEKAEAFAKEHGIERAYGSYEDVMKDNDVDIIYVATPMSEHYNNMMLALSYNKPCITEKAFTVNTKEAEEVLSLAKEKKVFITEAIWTRYMPCRKIISDIIKSGRLGKVTTITANLSYDIKDKERIKKPELGGGTLLDIAIYPINFALMAEEGIEIESITGTAVKNEYGVDIKDSIIMNFKDGVQALLFSDGTTDSDKRGMIYMTNGYIEVENINNPESIKIYSSGREAKLLETIVLKKDVNGYEYEFYASEKALKENKLECPEMSHAETIRVMKIMDALRAEWNIKLGSELEE